MIFSQSVVSQNTKYEFMNFMQSEYRACPQFKSYHILRALRLVVNTPGAVCRILEEYIFLMYWIGSHSKNFQTYCQKSYLPLSKIQKSAAGIPFERIENVPIFYPLDHTQFYFYSNNIYQLDRTSHSSHSHWMQYNYLVHPLTIIIIIHNSFS